MRSIKHRNNSSYNTLKASRKVRSEDLKKFIPEFHGIPAVKVYNAPGNAEVVMNLEPGQTIFTNGPTMVWMDSAIRVHTTTSGIFAGLRRAFTGDSMFLTYFTGTSPKGNKICLASNLPGDITKLIVKPGTRKLIASHGVVCCTSNVKLDVVFRARGLFVGGAFLSEVSVPATSTEPGVVWLGSFGSINTIEVKEGEMYQVDNHHFLAANGDVNYTIGTLGGLKSTLFSGEGLVMNFRGPCKLMIQNRKLHSFVEHLKRHGLERK